MNNAEATHIIFAQLHHKKYRELGGSVPRNKYRATLRQIIRDYSIGVDSSECLTRLCELSAPFRPKLQALRKMGGMMVSVGPTTATINANSN